jgi:hypothetical protein
LDIDMRKLLVRVVVVLTAMVVWPDAASACSCPDRRPTTALQYREWLPTFNGAVFRGTVLSVEQVQPAPSVEQVQPAQSSEPQEAPFPTWWLKVTWRVDRYWKGVTSSPLVIYTGPDDASCGIRFTVGGSYLVAADPRDGSLTANICTLGWFYTRDPEAFRAALGEGAPPPAL